MTEQRGNVLTAISGVGALVALGGVVAYFMGDHTVTALAFTVGGVVVVFVAQVIYGLSE